MIVKPGNSLKNCFKIELRVEYITEPFLIDLIRKNIKHFVTSSKIITLVITQIIVHNYKNAPVERVVIMIRKR